MKFSRIVLALLFSSMICLVGADTLTLNLNKPSRKTVVQHSDALVREYATHLAALSQSYIAERKKEGLWPKGFQLSFPMVVRLNHQSQVRPHPMAGGDLVLQFDSSGSEAFPTAYQALLQSVFDSAKPTLDLLFGMPAVGGVVHVANFDASIGDRQASAGGYYLPNNGNGVPEIRFPIYNQNEAAAVNFVHCLLLAYLGPDGYSSDAFEEGLVRAVTMRTVRTGGAMPASLDPATLENDLETTYDIGSFYDWNNQRALGGPQFIAPNLITSPLPTSGGAGLYLSRYEMAGSAWAKVLVEYPTFAQLLNQAVYANPALGSNIPGLVSEGQSIITSLRPADATVEGLSFSDWFNRQYILQTGLVQGTKEFLDATPITSGLASPDFGVFILEATYFSTDASGNETLLSGTSYPIFWDDTFNRFTTASQDSVISITSSQGTVAPNFPDQYAGQPYRTTVDVPVGDDDCRVYLPAGAIATPTSTAVNDFYGTVEGVVLPTGATLAVQLTVGNTVVGSYPVVNDAFGTSIGTTDGFDSGNQQCTVNLILTKAGIPTTLLTRRIDKTEPGQLAVDLQYQGVGTFTPTGGLAKGMQMIGLPIDPFTSDAPTLFNVPANQLLLARYNSNKASYDLYPNTKLPSAGQAYFLRLNSPQSAFTISGRTLPPGILGSVSLKPGWNMVTVPFNQTVALSNVQIVHATDFPTPYASAAGTTIGVDFFQFQPGTNDPITGAPEGGTFVQASQFSPGVGYFVRVLAPEGVVLAFTPTSAPTGGLIGVGHIPPGSSGGGPHPMAMFGRSWLMKVTATVNGRASNVLLGEGPNGGLSENDHVDSALPPGIGGLQLASEKSNPLFRDIRPSGRPTTYSLTLTGLVPGQLIDLDFAREQGFIHAFKVVARSSGKTLTAFEGSRLNFTATSSKETFLVEVTGR